MQVLLLSLLCLPRVLPSQDLTSSLRSGERRKGDVTLTQVPAASVAPLISEAPASLLRHSVGLSSPKSREETGACMGVICLGSMVFDKEETPPHGMLLSCHCIYSWSRSSWDL